MPEVTKDIGTCHVTIVNGSVTHETDIKKRSHENRSLDEIVPLTTDHSTIKCAYTDVPTNGRGHLLHKRSEDVKDSKTFFLTKEHTTIIRKCANDTIETTCENNHYT